MSISTVQRAIPPAHNGLFNSAKSHTHPIAFFLKNLFYKIATLGLGKSLYEARAARREEEIAQVATDTLLNLPPNFSEINNTPRFEKTLHTNTSKGYQIVLEGTEIVIYKITNEKHTHDGVVTQDKNSRGSLINFSSESEFEQFVTHLKEVQKHPIFRDTIIHELRELKLYDMPLLPKLNDIAAKFICEKSNKSLVQEAIESKKLGALKFSTYEEYLISVDKRKLGAEDLLPIVEFLITHHPDLKHMLRRLTINDKSVFSLIDKKLLAESRAQNNSATPDTLDYELNRINILHELLILDQENTDTLRSAPSPQEIRRGTPNRLPIPMPIGESSKNDRLSIPHQRILANLAQTREESHRRLDDANKKINQDLSFSFKELSNTVERELNDD